MQESERRSKIIIKRIVFVLLIAILLINIVQQNVNAAETYYSYNSSTATLTIKRNLDEDQLEEIKTKYASKAKIIIIDSGLTIIQDEMFEEFIKLENINIPSTVKNIGKSSFKNCTSLKSIVIPENVLKIDDGAFGGCENLKSVVILNDNITLGTSSANGAFDIDYKPTIFCNNPSNAYTYARNAQRNFPYKIIKEKYEANGDTLILTNDYELYIFGKDSIKPLMLTYFSDNYLGDYKDQVNKVIIQTNEKWNINDYFDLYKSYSSLSYIEVLNATASMNGTSYTGSIKCWDISDNKDKSIFAMLVNDDTLIIVTTAVDTTVAMPSAENLPNEINKNSIKKVVIGNGISTISAEMFEDFNNLNTVIIPQSMQSIYQGAFKNCSNLKAILIPSGVSLIGDSAFGGCTSLRDVVILSNQITLGNNSNVGAFDGLDPSKITIYYTKYQSGYAKFGKKPISAAWNIYNAIVALDSTESTMYILGEGNVYLDKFNWSNYTDKIKTIEIGKYITNLEDVPHYMTYLKKVNTIYIHYGSTDIENCLKNYFSETEFENKVKYIYTISYYANGNLVDTQEIVNGGTLKTISTIDNYKPEGFENFAGWTTNTSSGKLEYANGTQINNLTKNINLYDIWSRETRYHSGLDGQTLEKGQQYYNNKSKKYYVELINPKFVTGWENCGWRTDGKATYAANPAGQILYSSAQDYYYVYKRDAYFYSGINKATIKSAKQYYNVKDGIYSVRTLGNYNDNIASISGWTFDGWTTDEYSRNAAQYGVEQEVSISDNVFYAIYKRNNKIKIKYDKNGAYTGNINDFEMDQYYNTTGKLSGISTAFPENVFEYTGYKFEYWTKDNDTQKFYPNDQLAFFPEVDSAQTTCTVKANWKKIETYTVTFYREHGSQSIYTTQTKYDNEALVLTYSVPVKDGYTFKYWETQSGDKKAYPGGVYTKNENLELYAVWEQNASDTYVVTLNLNTTNEVQSVSGSLSQIKHKDVDLQVNNIVPTMKGYNFKGWSKDPKATLSEYNQNGGYYWENEDATLYAIWETKSLTVKFMRNQNDEDTMFDTQTFTYGISGQSFADRGWTKEGYTQGRWYYNKECNSETSHSLNATVSDSFIDKNSGNILTLYAQWKPNTAKIYYYGNGATEYKEKADVNGKSEKVTNISINTTNWNIYDVVNLFGKTGYHIPNDEQAWRVGSADSNTYMDQRSVSDDIKERLKTETGFEVNLYANWQENTVTLKFYPNGDDVLLTDRAENQNVGNWNGEYCKQIIKYTFNNPDTGNNSEEFNMYNVATLFIKEGHNALINESAWTTNPDNPNDESAWVDQNNYNVKELMEDGNKEINLYVNWKPNTVTLKFYPNGEDVTVTDEGNGNGKWNNEYCKQVINYNNTNASNYNMYNVLTLFERKGYHIANNETAWKKDAPTSDVYVNQATYDVKSLMKEKDAEMNLYANWVPNTYTIKYDANGGQGDQIADTENCVYDENITLANNTYTKNGATFVGWNTQADGNGQTYTSSAKNLTTDNNGKVTLYAKWANKAVSEIRMKSNPTKTVYTVGEDLDITGAIITVKYDNNTEEDIEVTAGMISGYDKSVIGSQTITVTYGEKTTSFTVNVVNGTYILIYEKNTEDEVSNMPETVTKDSRTTVAISNKIPKRNGYKFKGWSISNNSTEIITDTQIDLNGIVKLYAVWEERPELTMTINNHQIITIGETTYVIVEKNTTANSLLQDVELNSEDYEAVIKEKGNTINGESKVKTGQNITIDNSDININVVIVVKGDVNSDGKVDFTDVVKLNNYRLYGEQNEFNIAEKIAFKALKNTNIEDSNINPVKFVDVVLLNNYRLK